MKWYHRIILWPFKSQYSFDYDRETRKLTVLECKYAYGKIWVLEENIYD